MFFFLRHNNNGNFPGTIVHNYTLATEINNVFAFSFFCQLVSNNVSPLHLYKVINGSAQTSKRHFALNIHGSVSDSSHAVVAFPRRAFFRLYSSFILRSRILKLCTNYLFSRRSWSSLREHNSKLVSLMSCFFPLKRCTCKSDSKKCDIE